jgi:Cystathionine beta-lyases/cystathionine gamma-synthases
MMMDSSKIYLNQLEELNNLSQIGKQMNIDLPLMDLNSKDLILNEGKLMELNKEVRKKWRTKVGKLIASEYKSTLWGTNVKDLQGFEYHFSYETLLNDENDFADLLGYEIQGMKSKTFLFSSGMAAISHMLYCFSSFLKNNLVIQSSIGYFETKYFLKVLASMGNTVKLDFRTDINANLFYFEPIKYDATLSLTDIDVVLRRINESDAKIKFVIMDSTMHNRTKIFDHLIDKIQNIKNVILCDIRSGLKLDQEGLELSNLGV